MEIKFWAVLLWICIHVHKCFICSRGIPCVHFQPRGIGLSLTDDQMSSAVHTALTVVMVLSQGHLVFVKRCFTTPLYFRPKAASCLRRAVFSLAYLSRQRSHLRLTCVHIQPCCTAVCHGFICVAVRKHSSTHSHERVCAWILYSCMHTVSLMAQIRKVASQRGPHQPRPAQPLIVYALRAYDTCPDRHVYTRVLKNICLES